MPKGDKKQKAERKYEIKQAKALLKSAKLIRKNYPNGITKPSQDELDAAYAMPDESKQEHKLRNATIKKIEKQFDLYYKTIAPYAAAEKLVRCFENRYAVVEWSEQHYEEACAAIQQREEEEERKTAEKKATKQAAMAGKGKKK